MELINQGKNWRYRIENTYYRLWDHLSPGTIQGKLDRLQRFDLIERIEEEQGSQGRKPYRLTQWGEFCLNNYPDLMRFIRGYVDKGDPIPYNKVAGKFGLKSENDAMEFIRLFDQIDFGKSIPEARGHSIESKYIHIKEYIYGCEESERPQTIDLGALGMSLICVDCGHAIPFSPEGNPTLTCDNCGERYYKKQKFVSPILISMRDAAIRRREERFPNYRRIRKDLGIKTPKENCYQIAQFMREHFKLLPFCLSSTDHQ